MEAIYDAAAGDVDWPDAVRSIVRLHHAARAILFTPTVTAEAGGLWAMHEVPEEIQRRYVYEYREHDPWLERGIAAGKMRSANTVLGQELVSAGELRKTAIYADVLRRADLFHLCSSILFDGSDRGMPTTLFALFRGEKDEAFTRGDQRRFNTMCRHVSRGVRLWYKARAASSAADLLAASLETPALVVRADRRVSWMNRAAEDWVRSGRVVLREGRLASVAGFAADVATLLNRALLERGLEACDSRLTLEAITATRAAGCGVGAPRQAGILIVLREHGPNAPAAGALRTRFLLTRAESELALALCAGVQLGEYAARRGVCVSTLRSQLKAILSKTGCRRQSELVALVGRLRPLLSRVEI
ncbi:MAG: helix-turn-helix transcriptional regulator [Betaproteobacteria bacterium]